MKKQVIAAALLALVALGPAAAAKADVKITDQAYVRHDGGSDATILDCNNEATTPTAGGDGSGERQQNEPTAAVNPLDHTRMTAGANDYCTVQTVGDAWAGFYYSSNGGAAWTNSLLPGYPTDTSAAGQASPLYRFVGGSGDPVQAWDRSNHLYYAGIAFNRVQPANGSIWLARYHWPSVATSPIYEFTTIVSRGTPSQFGVGHFEDKVEVEADKSTGSPFQGNVYVCWARFTGFGNNFVEFATSTNGGRTFTIPAVAFEFDHFDMTDRRLSGGRARDCGDGPSACQSGYVFGRVDSGPRIAADPVSGDGDDAYVVVEATVPGSETPTGTTYGTVTNGTGSQGSIYFSRTTNGGGSWSGPTRVDPQAKGNQFYPDVDIDNGVLYAVYHDSRNDNASGPPGTAADFRTVPFGNVWVGGAAGSIAGLGLETWYSSSTDGGTSWSHAKASAVQYLQNYEQFGNRDVPFFGDYNYVDVEGSKVLMDWTDSRETVAGTDPRYDDPAVAPDNGTDGFDVLQCRVFSAGAWSADNCPNAGGLDQNIFALILG